MQRIVDDNYHGNNSVSLLILGTVQDAGSPHIACKKECCSDLFKHPDTDRKVVSLGLIDGKNRQTFLFEATPDIAEQLRNLKETTLWEAPEIPNGIFLTHAHIGHYSGLMYLGKEANNAKEVIVYSMPKMKAFLESNGPWGQLVSEKNIVLKLLKNQSELKLTPDVTVVPFTVPHRDEYSETVGYRIVGPSKSALFIPDIDKWNVWESSIVDAISKVDYAFIDATFYDGEEIKNRNISEIPHPFVVESMDIFDSLPAKERGKVYFIHFNHTNPLLRRESPQTKTVYDKGFRVARMNDKFEL
ncbi:MBL fold metallo-hydrolase [Flavobacteriaceae bacterium TP-CH-4]|uniref:MBL fold metallo-hydrolase n=2 Tax=Pelagihabitans pacificus TaxID=2696054 RepID=A0A967ATJ3_9FLAO|nr:MBL fold metallo-hydrolase [Pelagihabitans pacificus]